MTAVGRQCHELRINDQDQTWRIVYFIAADAIVILEVFNKKTQATTAQIIEICRKRLSAYQRAMAGEE